MTRKERGGRARMARYALACGLTFVLWSGVAALQVAASPSAPDRPLLGLSGLLAFLLVFATAFALAGAAVGALVEAHPPRRLRWLLLGCVLAPLIAGALAEVILLPWTLLGNGRIGYCAAMPVIFAAANPAGYLTFAGFAALASWSLDALADGRRR